MSALALALFSGVVSGIAAALTQTPATPLVEKALDKLQEKLRLGKYAAIDRALRAARDDVLLQCSSETQRQMVKELKDHILRGFAPQIGGKVLSLPLAKIFLPLQAIEGRPALAEYAEEDLQHQVSLSYHGGDELDWQRWREEMEKRHTQLSVRQAAQRSLKLAELLKNSRAVLLGDPGTGKTTITRYITYALAAGDATHVGKKVCHLVPILVRIANYANAYEKNPTLHLSDYIEQALTPKPEFGRYLRSAMEEGACLIILDGLDEVTNTSLRMEITERIQKMVASYSQNDFFVTSRIIG